MFGITITNPADLITLSSQSANDIIDLYPGNVENSKYFKLTVSRNCCSENEKEYLIRPIYPFELTEISDTNVAETVPYVDLHEKVIEISGIDPSLVSLVEFTEYGDVSIFSNNGTSLSINVTYDLGVGTSAPFKIRITTTEGFVYVIDYDLSSAFIAIGGWGIGNIVINNPDLPDEITWNGSEFELESDTFGQTEFPVVETLNAGVYSITLEYVLTDASYTETGSIFVDTNMKCNLVKYVMQYPTSDVWNLFDALQMSNDCLNITAREKCRIWNLLAKRMLTGDSKSGCGCGCK